MHADVARDRLEPVEDEMSAVSRGTRTDERAGILTFNTGVDASPLVSRRSTSIGTPRSFRIIWVWTSRSIRAAPLPGVTAADGRDPISGNLGESNTGRS